MTNRLKKLREEAGMQGDKAPPVPKPTGEDPFAAFWERYNACQAKIDDFDDELKEIADLDDDMQKTQDPKKISDMRGELHTKLGQINGDAQVIKNDLDALRKDLQDMADDNPGSAKIRLQQNNLHVLQNNFANVINKFTTLQEEIKSKFAKQVTRHYAIAGIELDEDKVENIISQNPDALQQSVFQLQATSANTAEIVSTYNQIAARHEDILNIERSLKDLLDLFVQFSILVYDQGRQIDNIEQNIATATDYVQTGTKYIEQAAKDQKKSRKCIWFMVGIGVLVLIAVIVIIVVFST